MAASSRESCAVLADAFSYPAAGWFDLLEAGVSALPEGPVRQRYASFVKSVGRLSLGEWEELHTRTLDLNPLVAPYVGYHIWGESFRRGPFLARMNRALQDVGVDTAGELPDHIAPVLRYLASAPEPLPELVEMLGPALDRMVSALRDVEPANPYGDLFQAVKELCAGLQEKEGA